MKKFLLIFAIIIISISVFSQEKQIEQPKDSTSKIYFVNNIIQCHGKYEYNNSSITIEEQKNLRTYMFEGEFKSDNCKCEDLYVIIYTFDELKQKKVIDTVNYHPKGCKCGIY